MDSVSFGTTVSSGVPFVLNEHERRRHVYAIGRTGSGKTTFQRSLVLQDINLGRGVCVIDPHGDSAEAIVDSIPLHRINDTIYFNAGDAEFPIGFNLLDGIQSSRDGDLVASEVVRMFKGLFADSWGEWLEYLLKNTTLALLSCKDINKVTLASIQRMLDDAEYRNLVVGGVTDPVMQTFWNKYFASLSKREELERVSSTLNKVGKFSSSVLLRNIVGQPHSGFDMQRVMDGRKILIVNLSKGIIGEDNANFLGSLIVSKVVSTALRRSTVPEHERIPFFLHVDEFQNVTHDGFATIVSEARKYALSLVVAHQNFDQIPTRVLNQITKDVGTICAFKVAFGDSDQLAKAYRPLRSEALESTRDGEFWVRTAAGNTLVRGYAPEVLDDFRTGSYNQVVAATRWRNSRRVDTVEYWFNTWYGVKEKMKYCGKQLYWDDY